MHVAVGLLMLPSFTLWVWPLTLWLLREAPSCLHVLEGSEGAGRGGGTASHHGKLDFIKTKVGDLVVGEKISGRPTAALTEPAPTPTPHRLFLGRA